MNLSTLTEKCIKSGLTISEFTKKLSEKEKFEFLREHKFFIIFHKRSYFVSKTLLFILLFFLLISLIWIFFTLNFLSSIITILLFVLFSAQLIHTFKSWKSIRHIKINKKIIESILLDKYPEEEDDSEFFLGLLQLNFLDRFKKLFK